MDIVIVATTLTLITIPSDSVSTLDIVVIIAAIAIGIVLGNVAVQVTVVLVAGVDDVVAVAVAVGADMSYCLARITHLHSGSYQRSCILSDSAAARAWVQGFQSTIQIHHLLMTPATAVAGKVANARGADFEAMCGAFLHM